MRMRFGGGVEGFFLVVKVYLHFVGEWVCNRGTESSSFSLNMSVSKTFLCNGRLSSGGSGIFLWLLLKLPFVVDNLIKVPDRLGRSGSSIPALFHHPRSFKYVLSGSPTAFGRIVAFIFTGGSVFATRARTRLVWLNFVSKAVKSNRNFATRLVNPVSDLGVFVKCCSSSKQERERDDQSYRERRQLETHEKGNVVVDFSRINRVVAA